MERRVLISVYDRKEDTSKVYDCLPFNKDGELYVRMEYHGNILMFEINVDEGYCSTMYGFPINRFSINRLEIL